MLIEEYSTTAKNADEIWDYCLSLFEQDGLSIFDAEREATKHFPARWRAGIVARHSAAGKNPDEIWRICISLFERSGMGHTEAVLKAQEEFPAQCDAADEYFRSGKKMRDDTKREEELQKRMLPDRGPRQPTIEERIYALECQLKTLSETVAHLTTRLT